MTMSRSFMEIIGCEEGLLTLQSSSCPNQFLLWIWLWVVMTLSVTPSWATRPHPEGKNPVSGSGSGSGGGGGGLLWSTASLVAGVLALIALVGVLGSLFQQMWQPRGPPPRPKISKRKEMENERERAAAGAHRSSSSGPPKTTFNNNKSSSSSSSFSFSFPFSFSWRSFARSKQGSTTPTPTPAKAAVAAQLLGSQQSQPQQADRRLNAGGGTTLREYGYDTLEEATDRFDKRKKLGQGRAGVVFLGTLLGDDGMEIPVAVKRFHNTLTEESSQHVHRDLGGRFLQHRNVVHLHGYCMRRGKLCLVYDYMPNGSLHQHLFDGGEGSPVSLSWARRSSIIRGAAAGLHHLHSHGIIHGSVKASNILIEKDFTARVGDFGYSRAEPSKVPAGGSGGSKDAVTTDPTYEMDVFYYGGVVLEVVTGRRSGGGDLPDGVDDKNAKLLTDWVWALHEKGSIVDAVDAALLQGSTAGGDLNRDEAEKMLMVGLACSHPDPKRRPKMEDVVEILQSDSFTLPRSRGEYEQAQDECRSTVQG